GRCRSPARDAARRSHVVRGADRGRRRRDPRPADPKLDDPRDAARVRARHAPPAPARGRGRARGGRPPVRQRRGDGGRAPARGGGGRTAAAGTVPERPAAWGFYAPHLFDDYRSLALVPAAFFVLPVVRRPGPGVATVLGGGYVASGPAGRDRLPEPYLPEGLRL